MTGNSNQENGNKNQEETTIAEWVANAIADTGCDVVYGGHGAAVVPLVDAIIAHPRLKWVYGRNEHDAATMAAAHGKLQGGLGVVLGTSGPGATGLTTGLLEALMDRTPLLAITGLKPTANIGYAEFQDVNQSRLFAGGGIDWSKDVSSPHSAIPLLRDAVATALTYRTCVHLAIPVDIQAAPSPLPLQHFCASHADLRIKSPILDPKLLDDTAEYLVGEKNKPWPRNVIAVGLRAIPPAHAESQDMSKAILDLAEALNAPVLTRLHAKGVVDETHPLSFGVVGVHGKPGLQNAAALISTSDSIVTIGVEDPTLLACNMAGLQIRKIIELEPDAVCVNTRYNAEQTIVGDIYKACQELTNRVNKLTEERADKPVGKITDTFQGMTKDEINAEMEEYSSYMMYGRNPGDTENDPENAKKQISLPKGTDMKKLFQDTDAMWEDIQTKKWKALAEKKANDLPRFVCNEGDTPGSDDSKQAKYCHPASVLKALSLARFDKEHVDPVSRDAVITIDVGDVTLWASLCLCLQGGSRTLYSERLGTMGYALCAGVAGVLGRPGPAAAVVLAGDGGFQMSLQELATFQQNKRPGDKLLCIVFDNAVLGRVAFGIENSGGCDITGPDYVALARAYGGDGILLDKSDDADGVIRTALATEGLFLVHVLVDPKVKADMATFKDTSLAGMDS